MRIIVSSGRLSLSLALILSLSLLPGSAFPPGDDLQVRWLDPTTADLYALPHGETASVEFRYLNAGSEPLLIDNIRTSCGCTAAAWSREPLPPDSTGLIRIEYDARERGYFRKKIKVYFRGQRQAERLYIEGEVE
jgi:hypothetical protein